LQSLITGFEQLAHKGRVNTALTSSIRLARKLPTTNRSRARHDKTRSDLDQSMLRLVTAHWRETLSQWNVSRHLSELRKPDTTLQGKPAVLPETHVFLRKCLHERVARILTAKVAAPHLPPELTLMVFEHLLGSES